MIQQSGNEILYEGEPSLFLSFSVVDELAFSIKLLRPPKPFPTLNYATKSSTSRWVDASEERGVAINIQIDS